MTRLAGVPSVSVCVPVFNTARFLARCLDSILDQTLRDLQVVVVNDGSTDESSTILAEYARRDSRIVCVSQSNAGLGATRNAGMALATGRYVAFLDSDDVADPHWCETMLREADSARADLVVCDYWVVYPAGSARPRRAYRHPASVNDRTSYLRAVVDRTVAGFSWNKLYRRSLLTESRLVFPSREELENVEDQYFTLRAAAKSRSVAFVREPLVHYHIHAASIVQRYQPTLFRDQRVLHARNASFLAEVGVDEHVRSSVDTALLEGVFRCALNECKETNPAGFRARVRALTEFGRDPQFRTAYDRLEVRSAVGWKARLVLALLRRGASTLAYALARANRWLIERRTL